MSDFFKEDKYWEKHINKELEEDLWIDNYFDYLPSSGKVLELGCGIGQFSKDFINKGYDVISSDISKIALKEVEKFNKNVIEIDMREKLPFQDNTFDIVFANLSIHYFDNKTTNQLMNEINRVLKQDGIFIGSVNGIEGLNFIDKEDLKEIEYHYWYYKNKYIRLFDLEDLKNYLSIFKIELLEEKETVRFEHKKNYKIFIVKKEA